MRGGCFKNLVKLKINPQAMQKGFIPEIHLPLKIKFESKI